jgi:glycosyltransferase involved in cell wall biosynthesis
VDPEFCQRLAAAPNNKQWHIVYFGNLTTPNNIEAVVWLVQQVLPLIPSATLKIAIAGSNPAAAVLKIIETDKRITLIANPDDMTQIISSARVLVNPMQAGSGVNLKSVEMLFTDAALVSTSVGAGGLPAQVQACFALADKPADFAQAISTALVDSIALDLRVNARSYFTFSAINNIFADSEYI